MTYHVILFIKPESIDYSGPKKYRVSKGKFDKVCESGVTMIQFEDSVYRLDDKKIFSLERWNGGVEETVHSVIVCEAHKMKQQ